MKNKVLTLIGFAKKCGKAFSGEEITLEKIKSKKAKIVFIASDASGNTAKRLRDKANYRGIVICDIFSRDELGKAIGEQERVSICINDKGFAKAIMELLGGENYGENKSIEISSRVEYIIKKGNRDSSQTVYQCSESYEYIDSR